MIRGIIRGQIVIWMLVMASSLSAQNKTQYPFPILGGSTVRVPSNHDTLWVLKHSQYKRVLKIAKVHGIDSLKIDLLKLRFDLNKQIVTEKDSLIAAYSRGYERYLKLWEETSVKLEEAEVKAAKRSDFFQYGFIAGTIVTAVVGASLVKWNN